MADIKWIKITTDIFDDEKIKLIDSLPESDAIIVIWFKLLTLAGKTNDNGDVYISKKMPITDEMLSTIFNRPLNTVRLALKTFSSFGMIEMEDHISIVNWDKHQNVDGMEKIRLQNAERQKKLREKKKVLLLESNVTSRDRHAIDKDKEKEEDKELDKEIYIGDKSPTPTRTNNKFIVPTVEEIKNYTSTRPVAIDAEKFFDFYSSKGWMVGKNKMKDWKAAARTWERNNNSSAKKQEQKVSFMDIEF